MLRPLGLTRIFDNDALVPEAWLSCRSDGFRVFNPTLLQAGDGSFVMAYRVVSGALGRRLAVCRLDAGLNLVPGSVVPFSSRLVIDRPGFSDATRVWHADPRFLRLDGRDYLYWNDGYRRPHNNQFIVGFDSLRLAPAGRPLLLSRSGARQPIEKNWGLFFDGGIKALYGANPHTVLAEAQREADELVFAPWHAMPRRPVQGGIGELRGGAAPVLFAGEYYNFCHAVTHESRDRRHYEAAVHTFSADLRRGPLRLPSRTLALPNPFGAETQFPRLNVRAGQVIYICGALRLAEGWLVSYGINDERCALHLLSQETVDGHLTAEP